MSAQTWADLSHEAFHRQMADEGIVIECVTTGGTVTHMAYRKDDEEGLCGFGSTAHDAYLHLLELEGE